MERARDIDYAASAVKTALVEKFGRTNDLQALRVEAREKTISICDGPNVRENTRDVLLAAIRKADAYADLWQSLGSSQ